MSVVSKTDFDQTLNLPQKTIDTFTDIVKTDSFFVESLQDGSKFNKANEKNKASNMSVNISEVPMPISDRITPTSIINKVLKDVMARYSILKGNSVNHCLGFYHTDEMLKKVIEEPEKNEEEPKKNEKKKINITISNNNLYITTNKNKTKTLKVPDFSHVRKEMGLVEKNKMRLEKNIRNQIFEVSNLGTMINYNKHNYSTLKLNISEQMLDKFDELYKKGLVYSEKRPVSWCTKCEHSVSQHDIKYRKSKVKVTYFLCNVTSIPEELQKLVDLKNTYLVCSTIRPWNLLNTCKLIASKTAKFSIVKVIEQDKTEMFYIIESDYVKKLMEDAFFIKYDILHEFESNLLEKFSITNPLDEKKELPLYIVEEKFANVDTKNSSGINLLGNVDSYLDYLVNKELNITEKLNCVIDAKGNFTALIPDYKGKNYKDVNEEIISLLKKNKKLFLDTNSVIVIPRCKKCNNEITYRYLNKWYIKRDKKISANLEESLDYLSKRILYNNENKTAVIKHEMKKILNANTLSISNEKKSSVPIPAFYCASCGNEMLSSFTIDICKNILKEKGIDTWNKMTPEEILNGQLKCDKCECDFLFKDDNSLNDMFKLLTIPMFNTIIDNSVESLNFTKIDNKNYCIETRKDFFNKLRVMSFDINAINKINNINNVILHTKVKENTKTMATPLFLDSNEKDTSNFITTDLGIIDIVKKHGIDVLRLWAVHRADTPSIRLTEGDIINVKTRYVHFRKTLKFILSNLYDFNPIIDSIPVNKRDDLDIYIYTKMQQLEAILDKRYSELNFPAIYRILYKFCTEILENNYFEAIKYKLYITPKNGFYRKSTQSNLYDLVGIFVKYLQPILPLLFEECWPYIFHKSQEEERNILLFRDTEDLTKIELTDEQKNWHKIFLLKNKIMPLVHKACNDGVIKNSLEARVIITCSEFDNNFIKENYYDIIRTLNVSVIVFKVGTVLNIEVKKALGIQCLKCKNYSTAIGINYKYRHLCKQCANVEESIETNTVPKEKMSKELYIDEEHKNDDSENINEDINVPPPPKFDNLNLDDISFDDRLGDKMDDSKIEKIKQMNIDSMNEDKNQTKDANENNTSSDNKDEFVEFEDDFYRNFEDGFDDVDETKSDNIDVKTNESLTQVNTTENIDINTTNNTENKVSNIKNNINQSENYSDNLNNVEDDNDTADAPASNKSLKELLNKSNVNAEPNAKTTDDKTSDSSNTKLESESAKENIEKTNINSNSNTNSTTNNNSSNVNNDDSNLSNFEDSFRD